MPTNWNPIGLALGILYLGAVLGIVWWMTRAGSARAAIRAAQRWAYQNCIIVPVADMTTSRQAIESASQLACERHAHIILAYVIEVPLSLELSVPIESAEAQGNRLLREGEGIVARFGLAAETRLIRHRTTTQAILELAEASGAETIVIDAGSLPWWSLARFGRNVAELMRRAPCQVVVARAPIAT